jgi:hypothetical protein
LVVGGSVLACGLLGLSASMAGCSGDDNKGDAGDSGNDVTLDNFNPDVSNDVGSDVVDAGNSDAPYDATALIAFPAQELAAICKRIQTCCYGADAGSTSLCESLFGPGLEGNLSDVLGLLDAGRLRLDTTAATSCIAGISTMTCGVFNDVDSGGTSITATEYSTIVQNCYSAIYGTIPIGQEGCTVAAECAPNAQCVAATGTDGGATTKCAALNGSGQGPCTLNSNWQCQYRGYLGTPALTCETADGGTECVPKLSNGANCTYSFECSSGLCNQYANPSCASSGPIIDFPSSCNYLFGLDGG